jgi:hypothetical protein
MGNSESAPPDGGGSVDDFDGVETLGYRVLGVQPNSPASAAGLVSFFDFLIGADGEMLLGSGEDLDEGEEYDDVDFPALLEKFKGKKLQLLVWNIKCQEQRLVDIIPSDDWEGAGLLGVTIRLDNYAGAEDRLIRILTVEHNSPAAIAGLVASQDYLLGTTTHSFDSTRVLAAVLEAHVDRVVELYVYNTNSDKVRVVALMPTWSWGGNGLLGAEVGTGYLHRIPGSCRNTLGGSVERRVRWIGGKSPQTPQQQQTAALEVEPQLEMEPHHDDEENETPTQTPLERDESLGTVSLASQIEMAQEPETSGQSTLADKQEETTTEEESSPAKSQDQSNVDNSGASEPTESSTNEKADEQKAATSEEAPAGLDPLAPLQPPEGPPSETGNTENSAEKTTERAPSPPPSSSEVNTSTTPQPAGPAPAPFPMNTPPPPAAHELSSPSSASAEDLFSGPPPGSNSMSSPGLSNNGSAPFSTPHPPSAIREGSSDNHPPAPPVANYVSVDAMLPPPPKMSGARY